MDAVSLLQAVVKAIQAGDLSTALDGASAANSALVPSQAHKARPTSISQLRHLRLSTLWKILNLPVVRDWLKVIAFGAVLVGTRRMFAHLWRVLHESVWISVTIDEEEDCGREQCSPSYHTRSQPVVPL